MKHHPVVAPPRIVLGILAVILVVGAATGGTHRAAAAPVLDYADVSPASVTAGEPVELAAARAVLNALGGGTVRLVLGTDTGCRHLLVTACVWPDDGAVIYLGEEAAAKDSHYLRGLLAHEFAHVVTTVWVSEANVWTTPAYKLFDGDMELLADCMAIARAGYTSTNYDNNCTPAQLTTARNLWAGDWS